MESMFPCRHCRHEKAEAMLSLVPGTVTLEVITLYCIPHCYNKLSSASDGAAT